MNSVHQPEDNPSGWMTERLILARTGWSPQDFNERVPSSVRRRRLSVPIKAGEVRQDLFYDVQQIPGFAIAVRDHRRVHPDRDHAQDEPARGRRADRRRQE